LVLPRDGKIAISKPETSDPTFKVEFGKSIETLDLELDAASQLKDVTAAAWDPKTQKKSESMSSGSGLSSPGNLSGEALADAFKARSFGLSTQVGLATEALGTWAEAALVRSRLARIQGTVSFPGNADIIVGTSIELAGLGGRFNGTAFVASVHHRVSPGEWHTEAGFGLNRRWLTDTRRDVSSPPASGLSPGAGGMHIAKVLQVHDDPQHATRVKVSLPLYGTGEGIWVRLAMPYASEGIGIQFMPEVGDEVVLGFLNDDPNAGVILGALYSEARPAPITPDETNSKKTITTKSKIEMTFDDEKKVLVIQTPGGHVVTLSDEDKSVTIKDSNNNMLKMSESGVELTSPKNISISADGSVTIKVSSEVSVEATGNLNAEGSDVSISGKASFSASGRATASFSSHGDTSLSGLKVNIN
ncbi:MAG: phage baseplate assembly protein V, partial [Geminicoccaceae bacterium]